MKPLRKFNDNNLRKFMDVQITIRLENSGVTRNEEINLDPASLNHAAAWCGSYDILEMGQHFDAYVVTSRTFLLPRILGFPATRRYTLLPGKIHAPSVHGNIGEANPTCRMGKLSLKHFQLCSRN